MENSCNGATPRKLSFERSYVNVKTCNIKTILHWREVMETLEVKCASIRKTSIARREVSQDVK